MCVYICPRKETSFTRSPAIRLLSHTDPKAKHTLPHSPPSNILSGFAGPVKAGWLHLTLCELPPYLPPAPQSPAPLVKEPDRGRATLPSHRTSRLPSAAQRVLEACSESDPRPSPRPLNPPPPRVSSPSAPRSPSREPARAQEAERWLKV